MVVGVGTVLHRRFAILTSYLQISALRKCELRVVQSSRMPIQLVAIDHRLTRSPVVGSILSKLREQPWLAILFRSF